MNSKLPAAACYKVGGGLRFAHPTYVKRLADEQLYDALIAGELCYVFNSRQSGKSSLRLQTMHRLQTVGVRCASVDLTNIGSENITPEQWYRGVFFELSRKFNFTRQLDLTTWWESSDLSAVQKLSRFIEEILLVKIPDQKIVICLDEIDSVLGLNFSTDDFFALIRYCYDHRAENPAYMRLTFALFGVATPPDLMRDKKRTPFNIGRAIALHGFQHSEAKALAKGLVEKAQNPQAVIRSILDWTSGQPFVTQKLCQLVSMAPGVVVAGEEEELIENLVRSRVIKNWEAQDQPEHLRTIRDRLLCNEQRTGRLLSEYQQILQQGAVSADESAEQMELLLSGLVDKQDGLLKVRNRIYQEIFNLSWVEGQLSGLRFYSEALTVRSLL